MDARSQRSNFSETMMTEQVDPRGNDPVLSAAEAERAIVRNLPPVDQHGERVEHVGPDSIRVRLPYKREFMGAEPWQDGSGRVFSGPMLMGFADTAMYCCVMAAMGTEVIPVMVNLSIAFLRPAQASDLIAEARIVRRGGRLHYLECWLRSDGELEHCAHITSTYRVSRRSR
jgi:acyl-coenzyme A thioesterase PaaI-like protein